MIDLKHVSFQYRPDDQVILEDINLSVRARERVVILGPSGGGKSSLLRLIAGLCDPTKGVITRPEDRHSFVFQDAALLPWATVFDNVNLPLKLTGKSNPGLVQQALEQVELSRFGNRYPAKLSGGQRMRVSIARSLAGEGKLCFFDEPFAALDDILRFEMNDLFHKLHENNQWTSFFVTHSLFEACYIASRIIILRQGRIVADTRDNLPQKAPDFSRRQDQAFFSAVAWCEQALKAPLNFENNETVKDNE